LAEIGALAKSCAMAKNNNAAKGNAAAKKSANGSPAVVPAVPSPADKGDQGSSPKLRGIDSNPEGHCGPQLWQAFQDTVAHLYTLSLPAPSEEARFTFRRAPMPRRKAF
jgi:hypothetical protein